MIGALDFEHDGRTYRCAVEHGRNARGPRWWWFQVSGDTHRYAPFHASADDTPESVQSRIVEYYANHLARRAAPPPARGQWGRRQQGTPTEKK